jgi:hypothetical protein
MRVEVETPAKPPGSQVPIAGVMAIITMGRLLKTPATLRHLARQIPGSQTDTSNGNVNLTA